MHDNVNPGPCLDRALHPWEYDHSDTPASTEVPTPPPRSAAHVERLAGGSK